MDKITGDRYYHIYNQANGMINIFKEQRNYSFFLNKVEKHLEPVCEILAYALLKNHFHLIIKTKEVSDDKISRAFANLFIGYAKAYNKTYNRSGSLFKKPFKRKLIENESYLKNVVLYIHTNPVKDGFVEQVVEYPWTSYHDIIDESPSLVERDLILRLFDGRKNFIATHQIHLKQQSFIPTFSND
ncbi:MAG: transposase [Nonlabens sp.]